MVGTTSRSDICHVIMSTRCGIYVCHHLSYIPSNRYKSRIIAAIGIVKNVIRRNTESCQQVEKKICFAFHRSCTCKESHRYCVAYILRWSGLRNVARGQLSGCMYRDCLTERIERSGTRSQSLLIRSKQESLVLPSNISP